VNDEELLEALRAVRAGEPVALDMLGRLLAEASLARRWPRVKGGRRPPVKPRPGEACYGMSAFRLSILKSAAQSSYRGSFAKRSEREDDASGAAFGSVALSDEDKVVDHLVGTVRP
jgi:hypothetical protein